jgi:Peptidase A4 family
MPGRNRPSTQILHLRSRGLVVLGAGLLWMGASVIPSSPVAAAPNLPEDHAPMVPAAPWHPVPSGRSVPSSGTQAGTTAQDSVNWAGYAVTGPTVSNVAGSWAQPTATCPKNQNQQAALWVGIDGYSATDPTVEQIGTDSDCTKGTKKKPGGPSYYAWYQLYPQSDVVLPSSPYPVKPGDSISAQVAVTGSTYTMTISDGTKWHYSTTQHLQTAAQNSSAEWIAEAPSTCRTSCKQLPLADFGSLSFSGASANGQPISASGFSTHQIDMTTKNSKKTLAETSALSSGGSAFTITWLRT